MGMSHGIRIELASALQSMDFSAAIEAFHR